MADRHYEHGKRVEYRGLVLFENTIRYLLDAAAGAAEGGKIKMSEWIDVKERLPEKGDPVVALCHYEFAPDKYYIMSERYTPYSDMWLDGSARYWIPLPPLPPVPREEEHE